MIGINAKNSEFHAAMGLSNLGHIKTIIAERKKISAQYDFVLGNIVMRPIKPEHLEYNYAYYPVLFKNV
ncbi:MAG: hypothetical protein Ta2G_12580 [Termitinemataceae bacterium]|nr:MAG: hypothetical protein Ta2G_12580 [Termitinemataceae bacterium]